MTDSVARSQGATQRGVEGNRIDPAFDLACDPAHRAFLADLASRIDPVSDLDLRIDLERGQIDSQVDEMQQVADPGRSATSWAGWPALNKATTAAALSMMSAGYARVRPLRPVGTGLLAVVSAEKFMEHYKKREPAAEHALNTIGNALWSVGIGVSSRALQTAGPLVNAVTALTSSGMHLYQGKESWPRELIDAAENVLFAVAGYTESPVARAMAVGALSAGFASDALTEDRGRYGHAAGALVWAVGAGMGNAPKSAPLQSIGTGIIATAEAGRLLYSVYEKYAQPSVEATPQQPPSEPILPLHRSACTAETSPTAHLETLTPANTGRLGDSPNEQTSTHAAGESQFASAASLYLPASPATTQRRHSNGSAKSQLGTGQAWTQAPAKPRSTTL